LIIKETAYARAGIVGNPSDIFGGKTLSLLFDRFQVEVLLYETPLLHVVPNEIDLNTFEGLDALVRNRRHYGYYGGIRIIEAMLVRFKNYCDDHGIVLKGKNCTIEYKTDVPFGVGLGGSSAVIKAVLSALMRFHELTEEDIPKPIQPSLILEAETAELDISAGPQDRVVAVYGGLVYMDFSPNAFESNNGLHGEYFNLDPGLLPPLFIAYKEELAKSSGKIHNAMRYRASIDHDEKVLAVMKEKARLVDEAKEILMAGEQDKLAPIMDRDFELRRSVYNLSPENIRMIEIARNLGSHAKFTGSGGAAIGVYHDDEHFEALKRAYHEAGYDTFKVNPVEYP
jgi:glucuronokinase